MSTQTELLARQEAATEALETDQALLHSFLHGSAVATVTTESGEIPTLAGLLEEIRQRVGQRTLVYNFWAPDLQRYENSAEEMVVVATEKTLYYPELLEGSVFRLKEPPSGAAITFTLAINGFTYTVTFEDDSTEGVVTGESGPITVPAGSTIELTLDGSSLNARGFYYTLVGAVELPPED